MVAYDCELLSEEVRELARAHAECDEHMARGELWGRLERARAALADCEQFHDHGCACDDCCDGWAV